MAEAIDSAVKALEDRLSEAVKTYEGQVNQNGEAVKSVREDVRKLSEDHKQALDESRNNGERLKDIEQQIVEGFKGKGSEPGKSWGESVTESQSFEQYKSGSAGKARVEVKNTVVGGQSQGTTNGIVATERTQRVGSGGFRPLSVLDFVPQGQTSSNSIEYARETVYSNAAAETAEGAAKPESDLTFETVTDPVRTVASFIRVSKQVMDDAPALASYIDNRLSNGVQSRLQAQILAGNGTGADLAGIAMAERHSAFTAVSSDSQFDSINKAKYQVVGNDFNPNFIFLNPADWGAMERIKKTDEGYVAAGVAVSYVNSGITPTVWGMPVVTSNSVPSGKFIVGDSNAVMLFMRQGATVELFEQDSDNATQNLITVRAELRAAFSVFSPAGLVYGDLTTA